MLLKKVLTVAILAVTASLPGVKLSAADSPLVEMEGEIAKGYGKRLSEMFTKSLKDPQFKLEGDSDKAVGLYNPNSNEGIIAIPVKGWKEDPENKEVEKEHGAPLCVLLMSPNYTPLADGKPIDEKKLRTVKFGDKDNPRKANCFLCSIKHSEGDDWRLCIYGADKEPLVKAKFGEAPEGTPKGDLILTVKDPKDNKADLMVSIFGKYAAAVPITHKAD